MTDIYQVPEVGNEQPSNQQSDPLEFYKIYKGSRIAISAQVGKNWQRKLDSAIKAYESVHAAWDQAMRYYNNNQDKTLETPRGMFKRGDSTENLVYSNINVMLPATYAKDPDIAISTSDPEDEEFCKSLQTLLNVLFRRRDKLNAKHKLRRAVGFGLLTNQGVFKLEYTLKDDSREAVALEMSRITAELEKAKDQEEVDELYGQLAALEQNMEVYEQSGPGLKNVLPHRLIVDPYAENPDGLDGMWMMEEIYMNTAALNARFTEKKKGKDDDHLIYAPTHKAVWADASTGERDDGLGLVMQELDRTVNVMGHTNEEREAYIQMSYTRCYIVWDKATRRVMLFHSDDWKWPIWVWDDPYHLQRFFPYFIISFGFSTGGVTSPGEVAYYLDQQDEVNDINRQVSKIRRTIFDYWFYNSDTVNKSEAEKFIKAIRGETTGGDRILGVRAGENRKVSDMFEALMPPSAQAEAFFNKEPIMNSIDRLTNTNDAIRGVQFKTNTTEDAVQSYQEAARLAIGAKVDVIEDTIADMAYALAEMCVQFLTQEDVAKLIGQKAAEAWQQMSLERFQSEITITLVAGSMEKPNSVYKKKEAVQIAQAVGQFAQAAPGSSLKIMLKVLEKAFTEVNVTAEDWDSVEQEIMATMQKGISTGGAAEGPPAQPGATPEAAAAGAPQQPAAQGADTQALLQQALQLPPEMKQKVVQMHQSGVPVEQIVQLLQQQTGGGMPPSQPQMPQMPPQPMQ